MALLKGNAVPPGERSSREAVNCGRAQCSCLPKQSQGACRRNAVDKLRAKHGSSWQNGANHTEQAALDVRHTRVAGGQSQGRQHGMRGCNAALRTVAACMMAAP